jgi:hypothetical protein
MNQKIYDILTYLFISKQYNAVSYVLAKVKSCCIYPSVPHCKGGKAGNRAELLILVATKSNHNYISQFVS